MVRGDGHSGREPCDFNREVGAEHSEKVTAEHGLQNEGLGIYHQEEHSNRENCQGKGPRHLSGVFKKQKMPWPEQHEERWGLQRKIGG